MKEMEAIHVVYANWCPHCVPTTVEKLKKKAKELNIPCVLYDIDDSNASAKADELVKRYGDWSTDYLVPQIFLEYSGGEFRHVLTGYSEGLELTLRALENLLNSSLFAK